MHFHWSFAYISHITAKKNKKTNCLQPSSVPCGCDPQSPAWTLPTDRIFSPCYWPSWIIQKDTILHCLFCQFVCLFFFQWEICHIFLGISSTPLMCSSTGLIFTKKKQRNAFQSFQCCQIEQNRGDSRYIINQTLKTFFSDVHLIQVPTEQLDLSNSIPLQNLMM